MFLVSTPRFYTVATNLTPTSRDARAQAKDHIVSQQCNFERPCATKEDHEIYNASAGQTHWLGVTEGAARSVPRRTKKVVFKRTNQLLHDGVLAAKVAYRIVSGAWCLTLRVSGKELL